MPTLGRIGPYRFFFYSNERVEPPHVHAQQGAEDRQILAKSGSLGFDWPLFGFRTAVD